MCRSTTDPRGGVRCSAHLFETHEKAEKRYREVLNDPAAPEVARLRAEKRFNELDRELDCVALTEHEQAEETFSTLEAKSTAGKQLSSVEEGRVKRAAATIARHDHLENVRSNGTPEERAELRQKEMEAVSRKNAERYLNSITQPGEVGTDLPDRNADIIDTFSYIIYKQVRPGSKTPKDGTVLTEAEQEVFANALTDFDDGIEYRTKPAEEAATEPEVEAPQPPTTDDVLALLHAARTPTADTPEEAANSTTAPSSPEQPDSTSAPAVPPLRAKDPVAEEARHQAELEAWKQSQQKVEAEWAAEDAKRAAQFAAQLETTRRNNLLAEEQRRQARRADPKKAKRAARSAYVREQKAREQSKRTIYRATLNPFSKEHREALEADYRILGRFSPDERKQMEKTLARQRFLALFPGTAAHERAIVRVTAEREERAKQERDAERAKQRAAVAAAVDARERRNEKWANFLSFGRS